MIRPSRCARGSHRRGYTMVEMVIALAMVTLLGALLGRACASFGRPALEVDARARIAQEAVLAAQSLACDLGGFLGDAPGRTGTLSQYQFLNWTLSDGSVLWLNFQGADSTDFVVITYQLQGDLLVRYNASTGVTTPIAKYVTGFTVAANPDNANQALIQITISFRYFTGTYTLIAVNPS